MVDQFRGIGGNANLQDLTQAANNNTTGAQQTKDGKDFKSVLMESIDEVNRLQTEADQAMTDLATKKTDNVDEVFTAVKKAELAFQTLMQIRNKLESAYDEIKQMRV